MVNTFRRFCLVLTALCLVTGTFATAHAAATLAKLSATDLVDLGRIERYLNDIKTLQARFAQTADKGAQTTGTFTMWRPGRMRLVYDPPVKDFIVADGWFVFYWDADLKQQSSQPIGASLADFFLRPHITLNGDVTVTRIIHQFGVIEVTLVETADPGKGELTLVLDDKPLQLRKWRVLDAQGLTTTVALSDIRAGIAVNEDMFMFRDPTGAKRH